RPLAPGRTPARPAAALALTRASVATAAPAGGSGPSDGAFTVRQHVLLRLALLRVGVELHDLVGQELALVGFDRPLGHRAAADEQCGCDEGELERLALSPTVSRASDARKRLALSPTVSRASDARKRLALSPTLSRKREREVIVFRRRLRVHRSTP